MKEESSHGTEHNVHTRSTTGKAAEGEENEQASVRPSVYTLEEFLKL